MDHAITLSCIERHRLLTQNMFASLSSRNRLFRVQMYGSGNVDGVDFIVRQQIVPI
jgi:hypothetical protein